MNQITPTVPPIGVGSRFITTLTGGGRSVVGNVTIGFVAAVIIGGAAAIPLEIMGQPAYALGAFALPLLFYFPFQYWTLKHAANNPDSSVTSEEHYARVIEAKMMAAKNPQIITGDRTPVIGVSQAISGQISSIAHEPEPLDE